MNETAKGLKGYNKPEGCCEYIHHPEYKLQTVYRDIGWELNSKIDSMVTFIEEHDTK